MCGAVNTVNIQCNLSVVVWCSEYSKYTVQLVCSSPGYEHNFNTYPASEITNFGVTYDYGSVMHYGAYGFSVNGLPTIVPKVRQIYVYFLLSTCGIPGRICGFLLTPADYIKTQNRKERQVVRQQPLSPKAYVHSQVSLSGVYGG
jgi:hypothetical protein